jgi:hypothetical protein
MRRVVGAARGWGRRVVGAARGGGGAWWGRRVVGAARGSGGAQWAACDEGCVMRVTRDCDRAGMGFATTQGDRGARCGCDGWEIG